MAAAGCDLGGADTSISHGPPLRLVATHPVNGEGTECAFDSASDCGVPQNSALELRFDRYLLPSSINRGSVFVFTGTERNGSFLEPEYDVVERVVRFRPYGGFWGQGLLYTVVIDPPAADDPAAPGFRAFDGAPLEGDEPIRLEFRTAWVPRAASPPDVPNCDDFLRVLDRSGCAKAGCHAKPDAPLGLRLDSRRSIRAAVRRVARETELGPSIGEPLADPMRFGKQMPLIDPGVPANSYLLYKLLINEDNFGPPAQACRSIYDVALERGECLPARTDERQRLSDWFVVPQPMPPDGSLHSLADLRLIQNFILEGARCD